VKNNSNYKPKVKEILEKLKIKNLQYNINGNKNIWIMKPAGLSRGRGIKCVDTLSEVLIQIKSGSNQYVCQKYIENPLIILNRKVINNYNKCL
jgi:tubulin monoglycylase TTLL3/8